MVLITGWGHKMDKLYTAFGFVLGFVIMMWTMAFIAILTEPNPTQPSWYGTYYSASDALQDGWYDKN